MNCRVVKHSFGITKYEMELYFGYTYDSMLLMVERLEIDKMLSEVKNETESEPQGILDER